MPMTENSFIDVRQYACPMSSVQARVQLDQRTSGEKISVYLKGSVAKENISTLLKMLNYQIVTVDNTLDAKDEWCITTIKP